MRIEVVIIVVHIVTCYYSQQLIFLSVKKIVLIHIQPMITEIMTQCGNFSHPLWGGGRHLFILDMFSWPEKLRTYLFS